MIPNHIDGYIITVRINVILDSRIKIAVLKIMVGSWSVIHSK